MAETISHDARWNEYAGEDWSDALVTSMKLGGVDHLFLFLVRRLLFGRRAWPRRKKRVGLRQNSSQCRTRASPSTRLWAPP